MSSIDDPDYADEQIEKLSEEILQLQARLETADMLAKAANDYHAVADYPHIHEDYCQFCDGDGSHGIDCEYVAKELVLLNKLADYRAAKES